MCSWATETVILNPGLQIIWIHYRNGVQLHLTVKMWAYFTHVRALEYGQRASVVIFLGIDVQPYFIKLPVLHLSACLRELQPSTPGSISCLFQPCWNPLGKLKPHIVLFSHLVLLLSVSGTFHTNAGMSQASACHCPLQWDAHKCTFAAQGAAAGCVQHRLFPSLFCLMSEFLQKLCTKQWHLFNFKASTKQQKIWFGSLQHLWLQGAASALVLEGKCSVWLGWLHHH